MSLVKVSGNASGTGTLTIAAPNTNSDYTLTLPQATTTFVGTDATQTLTNKTLTNVILDGTVTIPLSYIRLNTANGYGSTNNKIRRFTNTVNNVGTDITYADSATLGATFTINTAGVYSVSYSDVFNTAADLGLSIDSAQLTTSIFSINVANALAVATPSGNNFAGTVSAIFYAAASSVVRAHTNGVASGANPACQQFTIARVA